LFPTNIEDSNGYVVVNGFNENAGNLVRKAVKSGDRIVAVGSSLGDTLWPVSTVAGVISACTARLPGQKVTIRFERPAENLLSDESPSMSLSSTSPSYAGTSTIAEKSSQTVPPEQLNLLLQRCREVLKRYWSDSRTDFVGKNDIPVLVADKVVDAVASVSGSFDAVTLSMVMNAYMSCSKPDSAIRLFQAATGYRADGSTDEIKTEISGKEKGTLVPNPSALNLYTASSVMKAFALLGNFSAAKRILSAIEGKAGDIVERKTVAQWPGAGEGGIFKADTICYNIALSASAESDNSVDEALAIFASMQPANVLNQGEAPSRDTISYNTIIAALDKEGRSVEAFEVFNEMKKALIKPDKYTYTSLVNSCSKPLDMLELLYDMKEIGVKPDIVTYNTMIRTLCNRSQWYEAKKMISEMESSGVLPNSLTYGFLMTGLMRAAKYNSCISLFESACSDPRTMPLTENVHLYTTAISAAASMKNYEKAFDLLNRMKAAGVRPNIKTTTALMGACLASNMTSLAVDIYRQINDPDDVAMCKGLEAMSRERLHDEVTLTLYDQWRKKGSALSGKQIMKLYDIQMRYALVQGNLSSARHAFQQFLNCGFIPSRAMYRTMIESLGLIPPKRNEAAAFAKEIPVEKFNFILFVLDCLRNRNLPCDGEFYASTLITSSRMGPLRRKIGSLLVEARCKEDSPLPTKSLEGSINEKGTEEKRTIGWEELLLNYDDYKLSPEVHQLPSLIVRVNTAHVRLILNAEQSVLYKGGKSRIRTITNSKRMISMER
jgi:pentatricopeptide repeat protein